MASLKRQRAGVLRLLLNKIFQPKRALWDVGSVRTRVMVEGKLVFDQPTCVALRTDTQMIIATGEAAYALLGSASPAIAVIFPFQRGCVADEQLATLWLRTIRLQLWPNRRWLPFSFSPGGYYLVSPTVGPADTKVWADIFAQAGLHFVAPFSAHTAMPLLINVPKSDALWSLTAGGDHSTIVLVQEGRVIAQQIISWGGVQLTEIIQSWLSESKGCQVSWKTADSLKCLYVYFVEGEKKMISVQGKNPRSQLGMSITISTQELNDCVRDASQVVVLQLKQFLASLSSELATTCLENGLWLSGGTASMKGLDVWLATRLGCAVSTVEKPSTALLRSANLAVGSMSTSF